MYSKGLLGATVVQTKILERANVPVFLSGLGDEIPARTLTWGYLVNRKRDGHGANPAVRSRKLF